MYVRALCSMPLIALLSMTNTAHAECVILNEDTSKEMVKFYAASYLCEGFKAKMPDEASWAMLTISKGMSGIPEALGESKDAANACMRVVMPFIKKTSDEFSKQDRNEFCGSVRKTIEASPDLTRMLEKFGVL